MATKAGYLRFCAAVVVAAVVCRMRLSCTTCGYAQRPDDRGTTSRTSAEGLWPSEKPSEDEEPGPRGRAPALHFKPTGAWLVRSPGCFSPLNPRWWHPCSVRAVDTSGLSFAGGVMRMRTYVNFTEEKVADGADACVLLWDLCTALSADDRDDVVHGITSNRPFRHLPCTPEKCLPSSRCRRFERRAQLH